MRKGWGVQGHIRWHISLTRLLWCRILANDFQTFVARRMDDSQKPPASSKPKPGAVSPPGGYPPLAIDVAKLAFYGRHFGKLVAAILILSFAQCAQVGWNMFKERREVRREYFGVDFKTGRMVRLVPLNEPYLAKPAMLSRVQECVQGANTYDFVNFQQSFQSISTCFTDGGWNAFAQELERVGTLKAVRRQRLVTQAVATGVPVIIGEQQIGGVLTYTVQMPIRVSFQGGEGGRGLATQNLLITATVQRVPEYENQYGIGISAYTAEERRQ
ncbi:TPA: DotI/IcmL family type IV secretion protein [Stenotrophomonas maltophilia]|nr:DotI/IcmL family type IV secretion protein [Stenotrophomonas maltophilia]